VYGRISQFRDIIREEKDEGGTPLMPLDNYGFSRLFAWHNDRYGVSRPLLLG